MLDIYYGSDRDKAREALNKRLGKITSRYDVLRITDVHSISDLQMALQGPGMFGKPRIVVLDSIAGSGNDEMREKLLDSLEAMRDSEEQFFMLEGALDAATRKQLEKYADKSEKFDAPKKEKENSIWALANALQKGDKKALWVGLMREYTKGAEPEQVHGLLFWGAKQMFLRGGDRKRAELLVGALAELPHEARRRGEDLEYALERFVLAKTNP